MSFLSGDEGQGVLEYALILVLVAIVVIVILVLLAPAIEDFVGEVVKPMLGAMWSLDRDPADVGWPSYCRCHVLMV